MPLMKSKSNAAFTHNLKAEMHAGKPQKQALAIAYATKRKAMKKKMADGGAVEDNEKLDPEAEPNGLMHPHKIAKMIMMKRKKGYADGGMVDPEDLAMDQLQDQEMGASDFLSADDNDELEPAELMEDYQEHDDEEDPKKKMRSRIMQIMAK